MRMMRRILPQTAKERLHTLARDMLGLDIRFARPPAFYELFTYEMNTKYTTRLFHFVELLKQVEHLEGRIVECGVGPGNSIFAFSIITQSLTCPREIWGFDTFEGIPPPTAEDGKANTHKAGWWNYPQRRVEELLEFNGIDRSFITENIKFVPGLFSETLPTYNDGPIALLHLDIDFYESYKIVLESLYDHVAPGGIIAFDEYLKSVWPGATQAVDEFFADRPEDVVKSPITDQYPSVTDLYYVVKAGGNDECDVAHRLPVPPQAIMCINCEQTGSSGSCGQHSQHSE